MQLTVGGDKLEFDRPVSTPISYITTSKISWNRITSTSGAKYVVVNVKNFYLYKPMAKYEYYKIDLSLIPQDVIDKYNLMDKQINRFIHVRVYKGMYGLFRSGIIAHTALKEHLCPFRYEPAPTTSVLWRHNMNGTTFTLLIDGFAIRYQRIEDALHLISALQE